MQRSTPARCAIGIPGLDEVLHGGLIADRMYLLEGSPGAGKTTLALQFLLEGRARGQRTLYVTLSETEEEIRDGALSHGWSLDGVDIVDLGGSIEDPGGQASLTMFHPAEVELEQTTQHVLETVDRIQPARMVFDSLSELRLLSQDSLRYRRQILALKHYFVGRGCTTLFLEDRTGQEADQQLQSIAHGVIALEHVVPVYGRTLRHLHVVKFRGSDFRSGVHHMALKPGGLVVYPRLTASDHSRPFAGGQIASGVTALDNLLGGGIDIGTSTLVVGPAGSGKSTLALQYAVAAAARGDHAVVFAFDEAVSVLRMRLRNLGLALDEGTGPGQVSLQQLDPAEITPGEFVHMVRQSVENDHARLVVIDSLNGYVNAMVDGQYLTAQLHELLSYLGNQGVSSFLIAAQSGMLRGSMGTPGEPSYLADTVISTRFYEHHGHVRKAISVLKKRSGLHEATIRELWFDAAGVHLSEPLSRFRGILTGVPMELAPAPDEPDAAG